MDIVRNDTEEAKKDLLLKRSLHLIKTLQEKVNKKEQNEDIAIVGVSCRFPGGVKNEEEFWNFLKEGKDGICEVPRERWEVEKYFNSNPDVPGTYYVTKGGFLTNDIKLFDPKIFGISPREAQEMDPQQRMLLEMCWEAAENTGFPLGKTEGSKTGVFIGMTGSEYSLVQRDREDVGPYTATGMAVNIASGRIAHVFGFHGPAITLDTACSSSLVAVHLACQSIQSGDCDCAFAGGVNIMLNPGNFVVLSKLNALSEDGMCKVFDENANGYVRAEGGGIVILKKLSKAIEEKDEIFAVIKGSAVNQDGPTSGLTVPNGVAQKMLLQDALKNAGVKPEQIDYVEAHGTGTKLGDPIEAKALGEVFASNRKKPLIVGAVKSNIGHLEAAAGMAGLIKVIMMLKHKSIPANLHFNKLNPRIDLDKLNIAVPTKLMNWEHNGEPRMAGISAFGFSGTNVHLILQEAEETVEEPVEETEEMQRPIHILAMSAIDEISLESSVKHMGEYLKDTTKKLSDICYTQNAFRRHFVKRAAFTAEGMEEIKEKINSWKPQNEDKDEAGNKIAFVFSNVEKDCSDSFDILVNTQPMFSSLIKEMKNLNAGDVGSQKDWITCMLQCGIALLLEEWGIRSSAVLGGGIGEAAAYYLSGVINESILKNKMENPKADIEVTVGRHSKRVVSGVTGEEIVQDKRFTWCGGQERVAEAVQHLYKQGYTTFVEIGRKTLKDDLLSKEGVKGCYIDITSNIWNNITDAVTQIYLAGSDIDWLAFDSGYKRKRCAVPNYSFHKRTCWKEFQQGENKKEVQLSKGFDLQLVKSPLAAKQFEIAMSTDSLPELKDNENILHVGYYKELLCRAISLLYGTTEYEIKDMKFQQALYFHEQEMKKVYLVLEPYEDNYWKFKFYTINEAEKEWYLHTEGQIKKIDRGTELQQYGKLYEECSNETEGRMGNQEFYDALKTHGFVMGEAVKWVHQVWYKQDYILCEFKKEKEPDIVRHHLNIHPGILDACAQLFLVGGRNYLKQDDLFMIYHIESYRHVNLRDADAAYVFMKMKSMDLQKYFMECDYEIFDVNHNQICQALGVKVKIISQERSKRLKQEVRDNKGIEEKKGITEFLAGIKKMESEKQYAALEDYLVTTLEGLLNIPKNEVNIKESLFYIGMDSLVALEFKKKMQRDMGINIPMEQILQGPSIEEFTGTILSILDNTNVDYVAPISFQKHYDMNPDLWIMHTKEKKNAKMRLFCIPYGVKGASLFADWDKNMPSDIEVCPIQFPGKENRISEMPISDIDEAVDALEKVISTQMDKPFAFYGHSVGALIAYRISARLQQQKCKKLKHLFAGAFSSPNIYPNPVYEKVMKAFNEFGFETLPEIDELVNIDPEVSKEYESYIAKEFNINVNDEVRDLVKPVGFSDFRLVHTYKHDDNEEKLSIPITAFHGRDDDYVKEDEIVKWGELTHRKFNYYTFDGDHFFLHKDQSQKQLLDVIALALKKYIRSLN